MTKETSASLSAEALQDDINSKLLTLSISQIQDTLNESTQTVAILAQNLTNMMTKVDQLKQLVKQQSSTSNSDDHTVNQLCESIATDVQATIISFQFYDRLRQRLEHVSDALTDLSDQPSVQLLEQARARHTMLEENALLDMVISGMSTQDIFASQVKNNQESVEQITHDVELF